MLIIALALIMLAMIIDHQRQQQDHDGPAAFPYLHVNNIAVTYKSRNDRFITNVLEDLMHRHVNNIDKNYTIFYIIKYYIDIKYILFKNVIVH